MNKLLERAYARIRGADPTVCGTEMLCALARLETAVYTAVSVWPRLDALYGSRTELHARIRAVFAALGSCAAAERDICRKCRILNIRFELSNSLNDPACENLVTDEACRLCAGDGQTDGLPLREEECLPERCRLLSACHFLTQENDYAEEAKDILLSWQRTQEANGAWTRTTADEALRRLFAAHLYRNYTFDERFDAMVRTGSAHYVRIENLPAAGSGAPSNGAAETACLMTDLCILSGFGRTGSPLREALLTCLGAYLRERLAQESLTPLFLRTAAAYASLLSDPDDPNV